MTFPRRNRPRRHRADLPAEKLGRVVVSSRIRLARNLADAPFPDWATDDQRQQARLRVSQAAVEAGRECGWTLRAETVADDQDRAMRLFEDHLISQDLVNRGVGAGYIVLDARDKDAGRTAFSLMVNEEDHVRIQVIRDRDDLAGAWRIADVFDTALSRHLPYAFSRKLGYLTACPSNLGTGLRSSVMLALPALVLCGEFDAVCRAVDRLGFNARGVNGENTATASSLVQISNRGTLGFAETDVIARLQRVVDEVVRVERQARQYALVKDRTFLNDLVARSLALLQNAHVLQAEETFNALTVVRLGVELGLVRHLRTDAIDDLAAVCSPFAMRQAIQRDGYDEEAADDPDFRDTCRSHRVRQVLARATLNPLSED